MTSKTTLPVKDKATLIGLDMNERIRELAEQAEIYAGELIDEGADYNQYPRYYTEKFAELIVQECMTIGFNTVYKVDDDSAAVAVYQNIKEHFGVKE